jgi:hypothetical protein
MKRKATPGSSLAYAPKLARQWDRQLFDRNDPPFPSDESLGSCAVAPAPVTTIPPPLNTSAPLPSNSTPTARPTPTPIPIPIPMPTSVGTAVPTSGGLTCPPGQQISSLSGTPLCVSPMQANFRLADRNLPDWTPDFETVRNFACILAVKEIRVRLERARHTW